MDDKKLDTIIMYLDILTRMGIAELKDKLLTNDEMKKVYNLTGNSKRDEICKKLKISATTLSNYWKEWEEKGLLKKDGASYTKVFK